MAADVVQQVVHDWLPHLSIVATPLQETMLVEAVRAQYHPQRWLDVFHLPLLVSNTIARDWFDIVLQSSMHEVIVPDYSIVYVH
jgi:hypothetical protein